MPLLDSFLSRFRPRRVSPTETLGSSGPAIYGGYIQEFERDPELVSRSERYRRYSDILANISIVAAGTRFFLNLVAKASWSFSASEQDASGGIRRASRGNAYRRPFDSVASNSAEVVDV